MCGANFCVDLWSKLRLRYAILRDRQKALESQIKKR